MKFLVEVEEGKTEFFLELLKRLKFVRAQPIGTYKAEILEGLTDAIDEVNLAKGGNVNLKSARELLDEL